jgi:hypothetical protein
MSAHREECAAPEPAADAGDGELLDALVRERALSTVVPLVLERVERDPLRSAGRFSGDLVRGLMEVPGAFWSRHEHLYLRFLHALRACAALRRHLPPGARMEFWTPLDGAALSASGDGARAATDEPAG